MKLWQQGKQVINNKDSAEQTCKALKNIKGKQQIRKKWARLNTT